MEPAEQAAGPGTGIFAVPGDFGSIEEGVPVAPGVLHDPLPARREIVHDDGRIEPQPREVDDIEIGAIALGNHPAVVESITSSRRQGLLVHQEFERKLRAACPVTCPNGEQRLVGELASHIYPTWAPPSAIPQTVLRFTSIW